MKKTVFIKNALILTVSSFILRFAGIIFKVWLAGAIGSEGIGLHGLIFSVYVLASTFATSGISTAVTRLVAEETALGSKKGTLKILRRSIELTVIISIVTIAILYFGAEFIANRLLGDIRAVPALKILPFSLTFMGISSCLRGYFIARRKATPNAVSQITEQAVRILIVVLLVKKFIKKGLGFACAVVMLGDVISEAVGFLCLYFTFLNDSKKLNNLTGRVRPPFKIVNKILSISVPITSGRYLNSFLRTAENILVPKSLNKFPKSSDSALSQFGMIKGMALPVLFFPSAILSSLSTLLIPEMSEASVLGRRQLVKRACENILKITSITSFIFAAIFFVAGERLGVLIYKSQEVGFLLKALSPIVPLMYLDSISDGILKGLDQQKFTFRTAVSDSVLRILLIISMLPVLGLNGFIAIMYFSNILTCFLNVGRLIKVSSAKLKKAEEILLPLITSVTISLLYDTLLSYFGIQNNLVYIMLLCLFSITTYLLALLSFKTITIEELKGFLR
ncbi:MAG: polysaccharide biosynthesis protein [Clostridia bacterium]|nr:polysaccharide biosynthesis protein [Clostridia bacterium]